MSVRSVTKGISNSLAPREDGSAPHGKETIAHRPRNMPANIPPTDGFFVEVDAKIKSQHPTLEAATKIGAELKRAFPMVQVTIYDAAAKTRAALETGN
jgi:hypothetical protein